MQLSGSVAIVTGGASGLGLASAKALVAAGAKVIVADISDPGANAAASLGESAAWVRTDITSEDDVRAAVERAVAAGPLRAVVHCAATAQPRRILDRSGAASSLADFERDVRICTVGSFNVLRLCAEAMAATEPLDGERGVCVLTASVAAFEGQIGQLSYSAGKGGVVGMTLPAARDLAERLIRVATIAPGLFATPPLLALREDIRTGLEALVPHPARLGDPAEFAALALHIITNPMINGEVIRLDGAIRMQPR